MPTSCAHRVADAAARIVGTLEEDTISLDERFEQRQRSGGVLGQQLASDLVEPGFQCAPEFARLPVGVELGGSAPGGQRLAKPRRELVRPVDKSHPRQARLHGFVVPGEFKEDRHQRRRFLPQQ